MFHRKAAETQGIFVENGLRPRVSAVGLRKRVTNATT